MPDAFRPNLGALTGSVGTGEVVLCRGEYVPVRRVTIRPPGHDVPAVRSDLTAVVVETERGNRVLGANRAWIGDDLRVHWDRGEPAPDDVARPDDATIAANLADAIAKVEEDGYVADELDRDDDGAPDLGEGRYLLVECNTESSRHWLTMCDSLADAGTYHTHQEYREDWYIVRAVDLWTGDTFRPHLRVDWTPDA